MNKIGYQGWQGILLVMLAASLTGCRAEGKDTIQTVETSQIFKPEETVASQPPKNLAMPQYPAREYATEEEKWKDRMHRQLGEEFCKATEEFSCKTASQLLKDEKGNATYSPISLYFALSMAAGGAEGETKAQILKLLEFEEENDLAQSCRQAYDVFYDITDGYQLQIASSLWANQKIEMKQPFLDQTQEFYFAEVYKGDFSLEETKKSMGRWVKEHTGGLIEPSIELDDQTVLSIMNTIYYYDEWIDKFQKEDTKESPFTRSDGTEITCDFMGRNTYSNYKRGDNYTISTLETKNGNVVFLLPDKGFDVHEFLQSPDYLKETLKQMDSIGEVEWKIPKFSYGSNFRLEEMLESFGVTDAFSKEKADFSIMTETQAWFDMVSQETHVGVNENGIEATAFTEIALCAGGVLMPQNKISMILDRPFIFLIENHGCPLFIGVCQEPVQN